MTPSSELGELRVSTLELFFDLVFVFTITQLTALIEHDLSLRGVANGGLVFVVVYWMYKRYAWLTIEVPPTTAPRPGIGASHQTGWTGIVARTMHPFATTTAVQVRDLGKLAAATEVGETVGR